MMRVLSLFSGIGGIDLAAQWAGMETVAFCEIDKFCQQVLRKNFGQDVVIFDDVRTLTAESLRERGIDPESISMVVGGFPCQPFSSAGKRAGDKDDRHLWPEMLRVVKELRPAWVVGENVAGFVTMALDRVLFDLEAAGYSARAFVIPAAGVGAPHRRERCFIVAYSTCGGAATAQQPGQLRSTKSSGVIADANGSRQHWSAERHEQSPARQQAPRRNDVDGQLDSQRRHNPEPDGDGRQSCNWWSVEPGVGRVADGIPRRVDRLRALGNAVVPQQVYPILKAIADYELPTLRKL